MAFWAMTGEVYGIECTFKEINHAGKTDPKILEEVLTVRGVDEATIWSQYAAAVENK